MSRLGSLITAFALLITAGMVHGLWTERWQVSEALEQAAARVERVPSAIGDWQGHDVETDAQAFTQAGARRYWARSYVHRPSGNSVHVVLMCGRAGRMAVHTPEVCYGGAGFDLVETPSRIVVRDEAGDTLGTFWNARFAKQAGVGDAAASDLRLSWAWGSGNAWQAPANPRWEMRSEPYLYKLYASREMTSTGDGEVMTDFLRQFLPVLKEVLAPAP